mgnify:FL=1|tara:strand:+ start:440 stop:940 length:501 start_codon:yes stop_codon:yes gene_type:complete
MSKKFYPTLTAIPRLNVGDQMFRKTLIHQYEEAMVVSVLANSKDSPIWTATLMTKNGVEFISGAVEHRSVHDWMPMGWVFDEQRVGWIPPQEILRGDEDQLPIEDPDDAEKEAAQTVFDIPAPWAEEKFMSWRSRVLNSQPSLKGTANIYGKLSAAWKDKNYEIVV